MKVIGLDPGAVTGIAIYEDGRLSKLLDAGPLESFDLIKKLKPDLLVFEDSRAQGAIWSGKAGAKVAAARSIGRVDMQCAMLEKYCIDNKIIFVAVSPKAKGAKQTAAQFKQWSGYGGKTNQHQRDAALVAWPHLNRFTF